MPEPLASAIGAGLDISLPYAQLLIDVGEGVTDLAAIRSRRIVFSIALRKACGYVRDVIERAIWNRHHIAAYRHDSERLLREVNPAIAGLPTRSVIAGTDRKGVEAKIKLEPDQLRHRARSVPRDNQWRRGNSGDVGIRRLLASVPVAMEITGRWNAVASAAA